MQKLSLSVTMIAGLMGASGVVMAAAAAHSGGGELARTGAEFLIMHAAVVLSLGLSVTAGLRPSGLWLCAAIVLAFGTVLFSADLGFIGLGQLRPVPLAAPIGGTAMIAGWTLVVLSAAASLRQRKSVGPRSGPT